MSVWRVMGTETEYGISVPGQPSANAMLTSSQIVNAYANGPAAQPRRPRWDFEEENPLRDARGFDLARELADPSQLTDEDLGLANVILPNGSRLYVDHAHPEYSTHRSAPIRATSWSGTRQASESWPRLLAAQRSFQERRRSTCTRTTPTTRARRTARMRTTSCSARRHSPTSFVTSRRSSCRAKW